MSIGWFFLPYDIKMSSLSDPTATTSCHTMINGANYDSKTRRASFSPDSISLLDHMDYCSPPKRVLGKMNGTDKSRSIKKDTRKGSARRKQIFPREVSPDIHAIRYQEIPNAKHEFSLFDVAFSHKFLPQDKYECIWIPTRALNDTTQNKTTTIDTMETVKKDKNGQEDVLDEETVEQKSEEMEVDVVSL